MPTIKFLIMRAFDEPGCPEAMCLQKPFAEAWIAAVAKAERSANDLLLQSRRALHDRMCSSRRHCDARNALTRGDEVEGQRDACTDLLARFRRLRLSQWRCCDLTLLSTVCAEPLPFGLVAQTPCDVETEDTEMG
jgi:hypothetical protein